MRSTSSRVLRLATVLVVFGAAVLSTAAEAQTGPYSYYAVTPCRAFDSRGCTAPCTNGGGAITTTLDDATGLRQLKLRGICGIPNTASAVTVNHTVIGATAPSGGVARLCPYPLGGGQTICRAWTLYSYNETISNGGILPLGVVTTPGTDPDIQLQGLGWVPTPPYLSTQTYNWTIDVTGYFQ